MTDAFPPAPPSSSASSPIAVQLSGAFRRARGALDLAARVREALPEAPREADSVYVVAMGKGAPAMAAGVLSRWSAYLEDVLIVAPDRTPCALATGEGSRIDVLRAGHPLPDERSVVAGERALAMASLPRRKLLLVLVSGGASSLALVPSTGVTLEQTRDVVRTLLASGAPIADVNTVRRHLSRVHGGGLTRAAAPGRTFALVASDVVVGGVHDVGSGPTVPDPTTADDARAILLRYARKFRALPLRETLKFGDPAAPLQRAKIIVSPNDFAKSMVDELGKLGFKVRLLPPSNADAVTLASEYATLARELGPNEAAVRAAEPSLALPASAQGNVTGRGGRAGHLAAMVGRDLPEGVTFLCGASDGADGSSGAAGAIVDASFVKRLGAERIERALVRFDSATLHEEAQTVIAGSPSGTNFADVHALVRR